MRISYGAPAVTNLKANVKSVVTGTGTVHAENDTVTDTADLGSSAAASRIAANYDVRNISPREMAKMSLELYQSGVISFKDHSFLSFQPELNPEYDETIGRLTGTVARPDEPQDFVAVWEGHLKDQETRGTDREMIEQTRRMLSLVQNLAATRHPAGANRI